MHNIITAVASPLNIVFLLILIGSLAKQLHYKSFSLDSSAILICSIIVGICGGQSLADHICVSDFSLISSLGTYLLIASIGLQAGNGINPANHRNYAKTVFVGVLMSLGGCLITILLILLDKNMSLDMALGLLSGAMTSTPTLIAVQELPLIDHVSLAGYGISYFAGLLNIILFLQITCKKYKIQPERPKSESKVKSNKYDLILLSATIFIGNILGYLLIPFVDLRIGSSGGILICGLIIGALSKLGPSLKRHTFSYSTYLQLGLVLFFSSNGILAGIKFRTYFHIKYLLYGFIISILPIWIGFIVTSKVLKIGLIDSCMILSGGMTSSPGASLMKKFDSSSTATTLYSVAYISSLLSLLFLSKIMYYIFTYIGR